MFSVFHTISRVLPAPTYMTLPSVGVDISDTSLKYIQFERNHRHGQTLELKAWGDIPIPEGTLVRGNVENAPALVDALRSVQQKTGVSFVRVSLPEERAYLFETEVKPDMAFGELRGLLEFRLEENVPLSPRDAFFDYEIVPGEQSGEPLKVLVSVYSRETIDGYYQAAQAAGLTPLSFEVEAQAIARAALPHPAAGTHMIVDFGKTRTGIGIVHRGTLMYTSTIDIGGQELSSALRRQFGELTDAECTEIKNTQGLIRGVTDAAAYEALISTLSAVKDELALRLQYWQTHDGGSDDRQIESIVLCGGSANVRGLPSYFRETLGIDVARADVWHNAFSTSDRVPPIDRQHSYGYATAVGLGLTSFLHPYD